MSDASESHTGDAREGSGASSPRWSGSAPTITDQYGSVREGRRTYHGYMAGSYPIPNDGEEQRRLDMQHALWDMVLDGALGLAPVGDEPHLYVLDVGTGTGVWANEFAERHPTSEVVGTDLSLIQPFKTPNVSFVAEDSEEQEWVFPRPFDYVHLRSMLVSLNDVTTIMRRAYENMTPGGWIEFQDSTWELHCPDDTLEGTAIKRWSEHVLQGLTRSGRDTMSSLSSLKDRLGSTGFVHVEEKTFPVPGNAWMRQDPKMIQLGLFTSEIILRALESFSKILSIAGLTAHEIDELTDAVKPEVGDTSIHYFLRMYVVMTLRTELYLPP